MAEIGAAAHDLRPAAWWSDRIVPRAVAVEGGAEPIRAPLPNVAGHIVETVSVRQEGIHRRGADIAVLARVVVREFALPDIHPVHSVRPELVAPGVAPAREPAARRIFPL